VVDGDEVAEHPRQPLDFDRVCHGALASTCGACVFGLTSRCV
jgi:hypothetical protein